MDRILKETGSQFVVSRLSIVEMESVLATKVRTREIDQAGVDIGRRSLRADLVRGRLLVGPPIIARHYQVARTLLVKFGAPEGLRTLDRVAVSHCARFEATWTSVFDGHGRSETFPRGAASGLPSD